MNLENMGQFAWQKGIDLLSLPDFTHPLWLKEISTQIREISEGIYALKKQTGKKPAFIFSTEISSIYKQDGKMRRIHSLIFAPNFSVAEKIGIALLKLGCNLGSDGRPIIGLSAKSLLEVILSVDKQCVLIPAHVWTPHFGLFGSASGFNSIEECFGDLTPFIYGIETGISSDPEMNWQIKDLQSRSILSFSDAHSLPKMGREATVFELEALTYEHIRQAIMQPSVIGQKANNRIAYTIEFYPEEGKYHYSGHRKCGISFRPQVIKKEGNICPKCHKKLTEGVLYRMHQIADLNTQAPLQHTDEYGVKWYQDPTGFHPPFVKLVPLLEIVAQSLGVGVVSQKAQKLLEKLLGEIGSEINILMKATLAEIEKAGGEKIAEGVGKVRGEEISILPGFDGEYGKVTIWPKNDMKRPQLALDL